MTCVTRSLPGDSVPATQRYRQQTHRLLALLLGLSGLVLAVGAWALTCGTYDIAPAQILDLLTRGAPTPAGIVIRDIRLPRIVAAITAGWALSLSGLTIQSLLKNPLGSPATLGISQGAAFGAAAAVVLCNGQIPLMTALALAGAMASTAVILLLARLRQLSPEAIILAGVALSSLFASATVLVQFLATETQLAAVVFWTFGDVARSGWKEISATLALTAAATILLLRRRWDLNALGAGHDPATALGVSVARVRLTGMLIAALIAALVTAFHGVIAFVGLIAPHMARRLVGADHRLLIPFSAVLGALLLLAADTAGRVLIGSGALPVGVITSFLGAPMFLWLLLRGGTRG